MDLVNQVEEMKFDGIHLDIEPQGFPGWNDKNEVYLSNVSRTISWLDEHIADDIKLSESIPNYYPPDFLLDIKDHVDGVSVMCYENTNIEFVVRKVIEEQSVFGDS